MLISGVAAADAPTLHQVYEAAQAGRMNEAEGMMQQVLKEHPSSAKAHYVDAELLAKTGHMSEAREEINNAERLEPGLPFAKPQAVQELKARVSGSQMNISTASTPRSSQGGFPWGLLLLLIGVIALCALIMRAFINRNTSSSNVYPAGYPSSAPYNGGQPYPGGGYAPMTPPASGMGSGIMSGLATGAALGAGMVAGEALMHHFTDGSNHGDAVPSAQPMDTAWDTQPDDMGGADFGVADNSSWDDNSTMADLSGGDDWS